jgi:hypothetical protein
VSAPTDLAPGAGAALEPGSEAPAFAVRLDNFEGPFDLLLGLIAKHKLDITEVALSQVTDEFIAHVKNLGDTWDLEQTTSFLVVAATLLDLKAARLLPQGDVEDGRTSRSSRRVTSCSRGSCSTAPSSRSPPSSRSDSPASRAATRGPSDSRSGSPPCCPRF